MDLVADLVAQHGSFGELPAEEKKIINRAWHRYTRYLVKWAKYYDDCDLYEESKSPDLVTAPKTHDTDCDSDNEDEEDAKSVDDQFSVLDEDDDDDRDRDDNNDEELERDTVNAIEHDESARNLLAILEDGQSYEYKADHLETMLMVEELDTVERVCDYIDRHQLTQNLSSLSDTSSSPDTAPNQHAIHGRPFTQESPISVDSADLLHDSIESEKASGVGVYDRRTKTASKQQEPAEDGSGSDAGSDSSELDDANETLAIDQLAQLRLILFSQEDHQPETRLQLVDLALALPALTSDWRGYRAGHFPVDGICPVHKQPLRDCVKTKDSKAIRQHVHGAMDSKVRNASGQRLAKQLPTSTVVPIVRAGKGERRKKITNVALAYQARYIYTTCHGQSYELDCNICQDTFKIFDYGQAWSHFLLEHGVVLPYTTRLDTAEKWGNQDFVPPYVRWKVEEAAYVTLPKELELAGLAQHQWIVALSQQMIKGYGTHDDADIPSHILPGTPRSEPSDMKYCLLNDYGRVSQAGYCILCVHNKGESFTDAMRPYEDSEAFRHHSLACLKKHLGVLRRFHQGESEVSAVCKLMSQPLLSQSLERRCRRGISVAIDKD